MDARDIVRRGYDAASHAYRADGEDESCRPYHCWLDLFMPRMAGAGRVLDLGCGNGIPVARRFAVSGYDLTGVDLSSIQVARAIRNVPDGHFFTADMTEVELAASSFEAVTAFYSIIHVPLDTNLPCWRKLRGG